MKTTVLGFASIILSGVAAAPLLVQTDRISAQPFERQATAPATGRCDAIGQLPTAWSETKRHASGCAALAGSRIADAR